MGDFVESPSTSNYISMAVVMIGVLFFHVFDKSINSAKTLTEILQTSETTFVDNEEEVESTLHVTTLPTYTYFYPHLFATRLPPQLGIVNNNYWSFP